MSLPEPQLRELAADVVEQFIADVVAEADTLQIIDSYRDYLQARAPEYGQQDLTDGDVEVLAELIDSAVVQLSTGFAEEGGDVGPAGGRDGRGRAQRGGRRSRPTQRGGVSVPRPGGRARVRARLRGALRHPDPATAGR